MFTEWSCTDSDCCQYVRHDGDVYEMIQAVWLNGDPSEYCIVRIQIDLDDYWDEEKETYIRPYGYTLESIVEEYGDDADFIIAECIMEIESLCDDCVIGDVDSFEEAKEKIEEIIGG